jgi:hypothetical protein
VSRGLIAVALLAAPGCRRPEPPVAVALPAPPPAPTPPPPPRSPEYDRHMAAGRDAEPRRALACRALLARRRGSSGGHRRPRSRRGDARLGPRARDARRRRPGEGDVRDPRGVEEGRSDAPSGAGGVARARGRRRHPRAATRTRRSRRAASPTRGSPCGCGERRASSPKKARTSSRRSATSRRSRSASTPRRSSACTPTVSRRRRRRWPRATSPTRGTGSRRGAHRPGPRRGLLSKARAAYERALQSKPDDPVAKRELEEIRGRQLVLVDRLF